MELEVAVPRLGPAVWWVSGVRPRHTNSKGTTVKKSSQIQTVGVTAFPERVTVAMAENMQEGLLALAVGAGLEVM